MNPDNLSTPMGALTKAIQGLTGAFDNYQKATTSIGVSFKDSTAMLASTMDGLEGSFNTRFTASLEALSSGLGFNSKGVAQLINEQKLTNQNSRETARIFRDLQTSFGMTTEALNDLASKTTVMANQFGMTSTNLLKVIDQIKQTAPVQLLTGIGDKFNEGVMMLTAQLGPGQQDVATRAINAFMDPTFDKMGELSVLGIEHYRQAVIDAKDSQEVFDTLTKVFKQAGKTIDDFAGGSEATFSDVQVTLATLGGDVAAFKQVSDQMGRKQATDAENLAKLGQDFGTMVDNIITPFQRVMMETLLPALQQFVSGGMEDLKVVSENLAIYIGSFFTNFSKTLDMTVNAIKMGVIDGFSFLLGAMGFLTDETKQTFLASRTKAAEDAMATWKLLRAGFDQAKADAEEAARQRNRGLGYQEELINEARNNTGAESFTNLSARDISQSLMDLIAGPTPENPQLRELVEIASDQTALTARMVLENGRTRLEGATGE